jgi:hypothetical protein
MNQKSNLISLSERRKKKQPNKQSATAEKPQQRSFAEELTRELELRDNALMKALDGAYARIEELERRQDATFRLLKLALKKED